MRSRLTLFLPPALLGAFLLIVPSSVNAQQSGTTDQGQTGEFNGEHVDTGAAALDQGPEVPEVSEHEAASAQIPARMTLPTRNLRTTLSRATTATRASSLSTKAQRSMKSTDVDLNFDLEEIMGAQIEEIR
ncbi:MAG: hypothetical protein WBC04_17030 [Candidatus Acidiferrales bacterium]